MSSTDFPHKASETFYSATLELVGSLFLYVKVSNAFTATNNTVHQRSVQGIGKA